MVTITLGDIPLARTWSHGPYLIAWEAGKYSHPICPGEKETGFDEHIAISTTKNVFIYLFYI